MMIYNNKRVTESKNMNMALLLLPLFIALFIIEIAISPIVCYICSVKNKQSKYFKVKIRTIFFAIKLVNSMYCYPSLIF